MAYMRSRECGQTVSYSTTLPNTNDENLAHADNWMYIYRRIHCGRNVKGRGHARTATGRNVTCPVENEMASVQSCVEQFCS